MQGFKGDSPRWQVYEKNPDLFEVTRGTRFYYGAEKYYQFVDIKPGTLTNFASLPWFARIFFGRWSRDYGLAAMLHDGMVGEFGQPKLIIHHGQSGRQTVPTWDESAKWFYRAMKVLGAPWWKRQLFYRAVMLHKELKRW